jgi:hypothetical protein
MAVIIQAPKITDPKEWEQLRRAALFGDFAFDASEEIQSRALDVCERIPLLLEKAKLEDNSENRSIILEMMMHRANTPRGNAQRPGGYRKFLRRR